MEIDLVGESIKFMILGMTVVFVFLYVLVQLMKLQAYIIDTYFPDPTPAPPPAPKSTVEDEKARVAAIIAAVAEFRKTKSSSKG
ncbi:OadG family transporter subunit [Nitratifractor sp.]